MKLGIRLLVIGVHVALILLLLGALRPRGCRRAAQAASPVPSQEAPADSGQQAPAEASAPRRVSGVPPLSDAFLQRLPASLPSDLEAATAACRAGVVVDWSARRLLWAKAESRSVPIASLTKMMTVLLLMEDIRARSDLELATAVQVTREAAAIGGRQVWLDPRESFSLEDLLRCVLIHSGNDAAYLVAQTLAGSEAEFVRRMNLRASELGLRGAAFVNSHGLTDEATRQDNQATALELAYLAGLLLEFPEVVAWSSTRLSFLEPRVDGKKTQLLNTNKLVGKVAGVNGMKTGYTDKSGYCLTLTCDRNGRRVVVVVTGCERGATRDDLALRLLEWAYAVP